jgi:hypothetical protein
MFQRAALVILAVLVLSLVALFFAPWPTFRIWRAQMDTGSTYMKSLTEEDIRQWIARTEKYLAEYQPGTHSIGVYGLGGKPVPTDLQELKIIRIDILQDQVRYVWMGGMDHTELEVDRLPDGSFRLVAHYNDYKSQVIWPKGGGAPKSNQSLEPPLAVVESISDLMKQFPMFAALAPASGGSAPSR